jgi:uncharacterized membrane protein YGL010W
VLAARRAAKEQAIPMSTTEKQSMEDLEKSFDADHQHPVNQLLHKVGVPIIALSVPAFFVSLKAGASLLALGYGLNFLGHAVEGNMPVLFRDPRAVYLGAKHFGGEVISLVTRRKPEANQN